MKYIKTLLATMCIALLAASCSNEMDSDANTITDAAQLIKIGNFPAFDEGTQTRTIGTEDAGKTTWAANDVVLLKIQLKNGNSEVDSPIYSTLTYDGTTWAASPELNITMTDYRHKADITAYYAPNYVWNEGTLALKSGKQAGTDEYLTYTATDVSLANGISISFASNSRDYSRLRVAAAPDMTVTLTASAFTAAGTTTALGTSTIIATTDAKGNAYFYGKWTANAQLNVELQEEENKLTDVSKTVTATSDNGKSYAIDGFESLTTYTAVGAGTEASPYRIYNTAQLMNFNSAFTTSACDKYITLMNDIDLTENNWTPLVQLNASFEGNFHTIKGMTIVKNTNNIAFVDNIVGTGVIQNLIIDGVNINDSEAITVGVFASINNGKIINCHVINGTITATNANKPGGLVSFNDGGSIIGCSVINTAIKGQFYGNLGGLICTNNAVMKGCMFHGPFNNDDGDEGYWVLAARYSGTNSASSSVYCENTITKKTKTLWGIDLNDGKKTNCAYVDGSTITWDTAITNMNEAIKSDITEYKYEYDATLGCPKMVKK